MKSSTVFGGFLFSFLFWIQFQLSDSASCSFLSQTQCGQTAGCVWSSVCMCASNVTMDVVFALDSSGSIGTSAFQSALSWLETTIQTALPLNTHIGLIKFSTQSYMILNFSETESMSTTQINDVVANLYYDAGWTYTVGALDDAMLMFSRQGRPNAAFVLIIITDGDPCCTPWVKSVDICSKASALKAMGITVVIIGVGNQWTPANVDCLVKNSSYLIPVQSYTTSLFQTEIEPKLSPITCPVTYKMIISEVKVQSAGGNSGSRFVEAYNAGPTIRLSDLTSYGVFSGVVTSDTSIALPQTNYLVLYDNSVSAPNCSDCGCSLSGSWCTTAKYLTSTYVNGYTNTNWYWTLYDHTRSLQIDSLTYDVSTWPQITVGYSYELKYIGYDHTQGGNWQQSCNTFGTPGSAPIHNCVQPCLDSQCQVSGDTGASCSGNKCICTNNYYFDGRTCVIVPPPGTCYTYWIKNATTGTRTWQYIWNPASTDVKHKYALDYFTRNGVDEIRTSSRIKTVDDYASGRLFTQTTGTVYTLINNSYSAGTNCTSVSVSPTPSPTYHSPLVYIAGDICRKDRCNCSGKAFDCTGPEVQKDVAADNVRPQLITVNRYPLQYSSTVYVNWSIWYYGDSQKPSSNTSQTGSGISPMNGILNISRWDSSSKISLMVAKSAPAPGQSKYRMYRLNLTYCTDLSSQACAPIYPSTLFMIVDITGGAETITTTKTEKKMPTWVWGLIAGLLVLAAIMGLLGYRYWWKHKQTSAELHETNAELDAAHEENELGFGRDLAQGDVHFNPIATGVPNTTVAPQLNTDQARAGLMAHDGKADVAVEKFKHREEFGQKMPDKRGAGRPAPPPPSNF